MNRARLLAFAAALAIGPACNDAPKPADAGKSAQRETPDGGDDGVLSPRREHAKKMAAEQRATRAQAPKGPPREVKPSGATREEKLAELTVSVPAEWEAGAPSGPMRIAQLVLPGPGGDAELVIYRFKGGAGGVEENIARWKKQFVPPEGKSIDDVTTVTKGRAGALATTTVDISGRYVAAVSPGSPETHDEPDYRMLVAIVEGSGDPFFFKAVGPSKTMELWKAAFDAMIGSAKPG
jgi:hypothetical protein